jgi:hypothetical protein
MDDLRSENILKHFRSRSKQPKRERFVMPVPEQRFVVYDQGFNRSVDDTRFKYVGTSPQLPREAFGNARNINHWVMQNGRS